MSGIEYPEPVREEFRSALRQALEDDDLLDSFIGNFTATLSRSTPKLAAYQGLLNWERYRDEVRALYEKHKDAPSGRWWPEIVAGCLRLDAAWNGRLPRGKDFEAIVKDTLAVSAETASQLVSFSNCDETGNRFHCLWKDIASSGPGLKDMLAEAEL